MKLGSWKYHFLLILAMVFWGGSWVSVKIVVSNAPPMTVGFFRFFTASLIFIPILLATHRENIQAYTRRDIGLFFVLGLVGVLGYGVLFLVGMQFTTSAQGSIIAGVNPITVSLLAFLLLNERILPRWRYLGFIFSFFGIFFVVGVQSFLEFRIDYLIGNLILLCGMLTWGLYSVLGKKVMTRYSSLETTAIGIFFGTILFFGLALTEQFWTHPIMADPAFWLHILYLGIFVTVLGFLFYFIGIENLGASRAAVFISLVPVFGALFSILILSEPLYWTFVVGLILVVVGILVINYPQKEETTRVVTSS